MDLKIAYLTFIHHTGILKGITDRDSDLNVFNGNDFSVLCRNLVTFGPVTPADGSRGNPTE